MSEEEFAGPPGLADRLDDALARLDRWRDRPLAALALVVLVTAVVGVGWWLARPPATPVDQLIPMAGGVPAERGVGAPDSVPEADVAPDEVQVVVHVVGAVVEPGLVSLTEGGRVSDAITAAGGPSPDADVHRLNLAAIVTDGSQVRVPRRGDDLTGPLIVPPPGQGATAGPVNLNAASQQQLEELPGVGPATAAAIVAWRQERGPFASPDDLLAVPGIGPAKLAGLRDHVET